jgi:hypothetical protein
VPLSAAGAFPSICIVSDATAFVAWQEKNDSGSAQIRLGRVALGQADAR